MRTSVLKAQGLRHLDTLALPPLLDVDSKFDIPFSVTCLDATCVCGNPRGLVEYHLR